MRLLFIGSAACLPPDYEALVTELEPEWRTEHYLDAASTQAALGTSGCDVILCESALPDADGVALLSSLASSQPQAARILIDSGMAASELARALGTAHRILAPNTPCEVLLDTLYGVVELRELLGRASRNPQIGGIRSLPPAPAMYFALGRALADPRSDARQLAQIVEQDTAMSARVLQLCRSAYFARAAEVSGVRAAVTRLGSDALRTLVLASEVFDGRGGHVAERQGMQARALFASTLARQILPGSSEELAATGALLAEIGLLVPGLGVSADADELYEAGAYLLGLWGLPMPIVEAVAFHRDPVRRRRQSFWVTGAVHVATALAAERPVDGAYLTSVGVADKLPAWQALAEDLRERCALAA